MTDLRKAAEMALEALRNAEIVKMEQLEAMYALQEALAQTGQAEERQERREHLVSRCDMSIEDLKSEIDFILGQPKREWIGLSSLDKTLLRTAYAQLRPLYHDKKEDVSVAAEVVTDWDAFFAAIDAKLKEKNT